MAAFALVFAALAALLHFYIFYLEVPAFGSVAFCRVFRIAPEQLPDVQAAFQTPKKQPAPPFTNRAEKRWL